MASFTLPEVFEIEQRGEEVVFERWFEVAEFFVGGGGWSKGDKGHVGDGDERGLLVTFTHG